MEQGQGKPVPESRCHGVPAVEVKAFLPLPALFSSRRAGLPFGQVGILAPGLAARLAAPMGCWGRCLLWGKAPGPFSA